MSAVPAKVRDVVTDVVSEVVPNIVQTKVKDVLSPTTSMKSESSECDNPNEYRNLLISLSGDKSDHILWMQCLMTCARRGEGEFSFTLDKCGVPNLKSGDYYLNLSYDCLDANLLKNQNDCRFFWEGSYVDGRVYDQMEMSIKTMTIVVNKCGNILRNMGATKGSSVLLYMPSVAQLPIALLGAARLGCFVTFINASVHHDLDTLKQLFKLAEPETIVTLDGFFLGDTIKESKKLVDQVVFENILKDNGEEVDENYVRPKILMIQHVGADPEKPPPTFQLKKRPFYGLNVPFNPGFDYKWDEEMADADDRCEVEWMDSEDPIFQTFRRDGNGEYIFEPYAVGQIALLSKLLATKIDRSAGPIWLLADSDDLLYLSCILAAPMSDTPLLMCEGSPVKPDASRFFDVLDRYNVEQIIIAEEYTRLLMRNEEFQHLWQSDEEKKADSQHNAHLTVIYSASRPTSDSELKMEAVQKKMKAAVDGLLDELDKLYLRDIQRNMFTCSSKCCEDKVGSRESIEKCVERCNGPLHKAQVTLEQELTAFQNQLSRCAQTTYDKAIQQIGPDPNKYSEKEMAVFQEKLDKGVGQCAEDHLKLIPNIKKRLIKEFTS
ncbi:unnamed protein product [Bursaphelenchus xylophilus]|uniref:acetate--CoA ligase n=1 Tax=Bursaphelenchus xylophilus TaxID=6326 RepID=A0A7I8WRL5_BURXY|nr:unnamed protein product [Bursaphelenchus xylophilus]CAG9114663.1 unnamed protein product [Bursaphelenchus xylophilus]